MGTARHCPVVSTAPSTTTNVGAPAHKGGGEGGVGSAPPRMCIERNRLKRAILVLADVQEHRHHAAITPLPLHLFVGDDPARPQPSYQRTVIVVMREEFANVVREGILSRCVAKQAHE